MKFRILLSLFLLTCTCLGQRQSHQAELRRNLLQNYDLTALPKPTTNVAVRFTVLHFDMNEAKQSMDLDIWISMEWKDPRLKWDAEKHKTNKLALPADSVWKPDLFLYNNADPMNFDPYARTEVLAMNEETVVWIPPAHIKSMCVIDMTLWPYDIHNCTAKFGSWIHSSETVNFTIIDNIVMFEEVIMNNENKDLRRGEWSVLRSSVTRESKVYHCCPEEYVNLQVSLLVKRDSPAYKWLVQIPCIVLNILTIIIFLLPPSGGEKIFLGGVSLLLDFFFLMSTSQLIGHSPSHTPLIVELISKQLVLTCASVVISAVVIRMARDPHSCGLPKCLKIPLVFLSVIFCLGGYRKLVKPSLSPFTMPMKGEDVELNDRSNGRVLFKNAVKNDQNDWVLLAAIVDKICLCTFSLIFAIHMVTYYQVL